VSGTQVNKLSPGSVTPVTTAETVVLTSLPYVYDNPNPYVGGEHSGGGQGVRINGIIYYSATATGTTAVTVRVRQGGLTGPVVGQAIIAAVTASATAVIAYDEVDTSRYPAQAGGGVYVVTVVTNGATANPSIAEATLCLTGA
jgi:hypothetical protein